MTQSVNILLTVVFLKGLCNTVIF